MSQKLLNQTGGYDNQKGDLGFVYSIAAPLASIVDSTTTAGSVYTCEAAPGSATSAAVWRISKKVTATGVTTWANGDGNFDNIADNRASISYS